MNINKITFAQFCNDSYYMGDSNGYDYKSYEICWMLYHLSKMNAEDLNVLPDSPVYILIGAKTREEAMEIKADVDYKIGRSLYFIENFCPSFHKGDSVFNGNIILRAYKNEANVTRGLNVAGAVLVDASKEDVVELERRVQSRFNSTAGYGTVFRVIEISKRGWGIGAKE